MNERVSARVSVLMADDDRDDRSLFEEAVAAIDPAVDVKTFSDGEEIMSYLLSGPPLPDLIFLDLNMPRKDGMSCLEEIRNESRFDEVPIVIYTTSISRKDVDETFEKGATRFLRKPNTFNEIKLNIQRVLTDRPAALTDKENYLINLNQTFVL